MATTKSTPAPAAVEESDPKQKTAEVQPVKTDTIQDQGIGPKDPYPTGSPATPPTAGVPTNEKPSEE